MQIVLRLAMIMVCIYSFGVDAKTDSPGEPYNYKETQWLIQILDNNRGTIYESRSEVGGLTRMLNILERYVYSMEAGLGNNSDHTMELHLFSKDGSKVLFVGDSWISDGEMVSAMSSADYNEMLRLGRYRNEDATRMLEWINKRNKYYERKTKKDIAASQTSYSDVSEPVMEDYEIVNSELNSDDHDPGHITPPPNNVAVAAPAIAMTPQILQSESISSSSIGSIKNHHNESPQPLMWYMLLLLGYAMILLIVVAITMLIIMYQRR